MGASGGPAFRRTWRSIKYEDIHLKEYPSAAELEAGVDRWMKHYNTWRPHQALGNETPAQAYRPKAAAKAIRPTGRAA